MLEENIETFSNFGCGSEIHLCEGVLVHTYAHIWHFIKSIMSFHHVGCNSGDLAASAFMAESLLILAKIS